MTPYPNSPIFWAVHRRLSFKPEWKTARRMAALRFKPTSFICRVSLYHAPKCPAEIVFGQVIAAPSRHAPSSRRAKIAGGPLDPPILGSSKHQSLRTHSDRSPEVPSSFNAHARRSTQAQPNKIVRSLLTYLRCYFFHFGFVFVFYFIFFFFCG